MSKRKRGGAKPRKRAPSPETTENPGRGASLLYGEHAVRAALANPARHCLRLWVTEEARRGLPEALSNRIEPTLASRQDLADLLPPDTVHQGIVLEADPLPSPALEDVLKTETDGRALVLVLDRINDPRNLGAVLRSAAAFGALGVVIPDRHAPSATGAVAKAASGALESVPQVRAANLAQALGKLKDAGFWCLGLDAGASTTLAGVDLGERVALVLGAEGAGLRRLTRETCDLLARIPMRPDTESLNLSNAAAVALYELLGRQTG